MRPIGAGRGEISSNAVWGQCTRSPLALSLRSRLEADYASLRQRTIRCATNPGLDARLPVCIDTAFEFTAGEASGEGLLP